MVKMWMRERQQQRQQGKRNVEQKSFVVMGLKVRLIPRGGQ
jgi:hypothetical protein